MDKIIGYRDLQQMDKIIGYRDLQPEEIALMNQIKGLGEEIGKLFHAMDCASKHTLDTSDNPSARIANQYSGAGHNLDARWLNIARTDLQKGFMFLTRAVAQPTSF